MKLKKIIIIGIVAVSLTMNVIVAVIGGFWLNTRLSALPVSPAYMRKVVKELSLNSAGKWRIVEHDREKIILEYRLPAFNIYRYKLSKNEFKLSDRLEDMPGPFGLSFDGCDIYARVNNNGNFECMKLRDLSQPEDHCP